jgi:hypothetical protein
MRKRAGILSAMVMAVAMACTASSASAAFGVSKWEAGTCTVSNCAYTSPDSAFYTQVAGRPPFGITDFTFNKNGLGFPEGAVRDVRVDLPPGLSVNPQATAVQCTEAELEGAGCPSAAKVGTVEVTAVELLGVGVPISAPVYNLVPKQGEAAEFGFRVNLLGLIDLKVYLEGTVAWEGDYHEGFTIRTIPDTVPLSRNRLVFEGQAGNGSFITVGSNCGGSTTTGLTVDSHQAAGAYQHYDTTPVVPVGAAIAPTGCGKVPFTPGIAVDPGTTQTDSPTGSAVTATVPFAAGAEIGQANVKRAEVSLPRGMGLNPSAAPKLKTCSDDQFGKGKASGDLGRISDPGGVRPPAISCPPESVIGTTRIETPVLPPGSLTGPVYLGQQLSRDPGSGKQYRVLAAAESPRFGVYVRLIGEVKANPSTGQLTAVFQEPAFGGLPQVPFSSFQLRFDGAKGVLTSPPICESLATSAITPWTGNAVATPTGKVTLTSAPGGGACAATMAARPFAPSFKAGPRSTNAATFTPFTVNIVRGDGQQELKGVDITLPPGATAKLAGVPYCPPAAIAAATASDGKAERTNASCPDKSQIGVATVTAGSGSTPLQIGGKAYLAGPYQGARLSLVVVTPALAGPYDLGTVVVRVPLFLDPETAQIRAATAAIPDVFGGAKLDIRSIAVNVNKDDFALTGTNCSKFATAGALRGGGADPTNPATFSSFPVSDPVQLNNCDPLKFRPKLNLRLFGATKRNKHPRLRAVLKARAGDANIARASVGLPHALFLDQASLSAICTRVQFAANECPRKSIYGKARAFTPLLGQPLEGPAYLRSSNNPLPDLVAHLEGQVDIDLVGRIDSFKGGIRTTFDRVPDVPVSKFTMILPGGKHGLLVASKNLCKGKGVKAIVRFKAQNGKKVGKRSQLKTPCGQKSHPKKKH